MPINKLKQNTNFICIYLVHVLELLIQSTQKAKVFHDSDGGCVTLKIRHSIWTLYPIPPAV